MKVLHISHSDSTGAGLCAYRISKSLQDIGIDSRMLVFKKTHISDETVQEYHSNRLKIHRAIDFVMRKLGIYCSDFNKAIKISNEKGKLYTIPVSPIDISRHPWVEDADIIHLHWTSFFLDIPSFLKNVNKPIVWTLHDEYIFNGIAHYESEVIEDDELEKKYYAVKREAFLQTPNLGIVFLSKYFNRKYAGHEFLKKARKTIINNGVDCTNYHPIDKSKAREELGIGSDSIVFVFVANSISDPRKGLQTLIDAVNIFNDSRMKIVAVGGCEGYSSNANVITTGKVYDSQKMSRILSAGDYFVMPSLQEAFAQTPIEAMACGLPAVVFPVSGTEELITEANGVICDGFSVNNLVDGIQKVMDRAFDPEIIRKDVISRFAPKEIALKYSEFYKKMM